MVGLDPKADTGTGLEQLDPVLVLAPVRGITDAVYRGAFARCFGGFDCAVAPFIQLKQGQTLRTAELRQVAPVENKGLWTIPQVLTNHAPTLSAALCELHSAGHGEVNWNLGCPQPMTAGRGRGAGLLPDPERIDTILAQVLADCPVKLSVKMRLGYHQPDEYVAVMEVLNRYPLSGVILHARTADQQYEGVVDVNRAAQALALCRHPFIYNGDIADAGVFLELRTKLSGAAGWMIGRGALASPFLPSRIKGKDVPGSDERRQRLLEFHQQLCEGYSRWLSGPGHWLDRMKEQWSYLALSFADPQQVVSRIRHSGTINRYTSAVEWVFDHALLGSG